MVLGVEQEHIHQLQLSFPMQEAIEVATVTNNCQVTPHSALNPLNCRAYQWGARARFAAKSSPQPRQGAAGVIY